MLMLYLCNLTQILDVGTYAAITGFSQWKVNLSAIYIIRQQVVYKIKCIIALPQYSLIYDSLYLFFFSNSFLIYLFHMAWNKFGVPISKSTALHLGPT